MILSKKWAKMILKSLQFCMKIGKYLGKWKVKLFTPNVEKSQFDILYSKFVNIVTEVQIGGQYCIFYSNTCVYIVLNLYFFVNSSDFFEMKTV